MRGEFSSRGRGKCLRVMYCLEADISGILKGPQSMDVFPKLQVAEKFANLGVSQDLPTMAMSSTPNEVMEFLVGNAFGVALQRY